MKVILNIQSKEIVTEIPLNVHHSIVIGRGSAANHRVADALMSSNHCKLTLDTTKLEITDLKTKNGTYVNDLRIEKSDIFIGDVIKIGSTKITILSEKMDPAIVKAISFQGEKRDRQSHGLTLDYTAAGLVNRGKLDLLGNEKKVPGAKKSIPKSRLSKQDIILKYKAQSSLARTIDIILIIFALALPLMASNIFSIISPAMFQEYRLKIMSGSVIVFVAIFYYFNHKVFKFTLGEKIAGLERLYLAQYDDEDLED